MPSTVNGIGTWYWGKTNIITRNDRCEFCGQYQLLSSYDTTLYFVVFFLPVIPLGRKHIIDECPACRRHRVASLKKWEQTKTQSLMKALEEWQAERANAEKARKAVGVTIAFHDRQAFEDVAGPVGQAFSRDPDMQIFLAEAYSHFGQPELADACYAAALKLRNDAYTRRTYAAYLLKRLRPDEARPLLDEILQQRDTKDASLMLWLAQAYQAVGNHDAAVRLIDEIGTAFPHLLSNPDFERVRKTSSKYQGTSKKIKIAGLDASSTGARQETWFQRHGAKAIVATIIAGLVTWYFSLAISKGHHQVHVLNGTQTMYVVDIDGRQYHVPAMNMIEVGLGEGHHNVAVSEPAGLVKPTGMDIRTNFWKRPFSSRTFVLNPDRCAVVYLEEIEYSSHPRPSSAQWFTGQSAYEFKQPNHPFTDPPAKVTVDDKNGSETRTHLGMVGGLSAARIMALLEKEVGPEAAREWVSRYAPAAPEDYSGLALLYQHIKGEKLIEALRERLSDRPLRVEWHRFYQSAVEKERPDYDLAAEYRKLLDASPSDSALMYLYGRVLPDRRQMMDLFLRASQGPSPCEFALYALARDDLDDADFDKTLQHVRAARKIDAKNPQFAWIECEALEGLGKFDEEIAVIRAMEEHEVDDVFHVSNEVRLMVRKGDAKGAKERIESFCQEVARLTDNSQQTMDVARNMLEAAYYDSRGDMAEYQKCLTRQDTPEARARLALLNGKYDEAEKALADVEPETGNYALLAALAQGKSPAVSQRAWKKVVELLGQGTREDRKLSQELTKDKPPDPAVLRGWSGKPSERCIMLTALGMRYPQERDNYFRQARKLNYATGFPQRLIEQLLSK